MNFEEFLGNFDPRNSQRTLEEFSMNPQWIFFSGNSLANIFPSCYPSNINIEVICHLYKYGIVICDMRLLCEISFIAYSMIYTMCDYNLSQWMLMKCIGSCKSALFDVECFDKLVLKLFVYWSGIRKNISTNTRFYLFLKITFVWNVRYVTFKNQYRATI